MKHLQNNCYFPVGVGELSLLHVDISNVLLHGETGLGPAVNPRLSPEEAADLVSCSDGHLEVGGEEERPTDDVGAADDGIGHSEYRGRYLYVLMSFFKTNLKRAA